MGCGLFTPKKQELYLELTISLGKLRSLSDRDLDSVHGNSKDLKFTF